MTKNILKIIGTIVAIIILTVAITARSNNLPSGEENKSDFTLGQLVDRMDGLRDLKEECVNNLNIVDSAKFLKGYTWYCDSWDAEITELRDQISLMSKKDYEGLN